MPPMRTIVQGNVALADVMTEYGDTVCKNEAAI